MDIKDIANLKLGPLEPLVARIYRYAKRFPAVRERLTTVLLPQDRLSEILTPTRWK